MAFRKAEEGADVIDEVDDVTPMRHGAAPGTMSTV
jgi:hypothetical protein